jgi:hypothetical protein
MPAVKFFKAFFECVFVKQINLVEQFGLSIRSDSIRK